MICSKDFIEPYLSVVNVSDVELVYLFLILWGIILGGPVTQGRMGGPNYLGGPNFGGGT